MGTRHKGIIAYGTEEDRKKVSVLSSLANQSTSEFIIETIRSRYKDVVGDVDPDVIILNRVAK